MARGYDQHQQRNHALAGLGRSLARRAGSHCELCDSQGVRLTPTEVAPQHEQPCTERAVLLCEHCQRGVRGAKLNPMEWRFLETAAWSEVAPVQVTAIRLLRRLAADGVSWATDTLDTLYLPPEISDWLAGNPPEIEWA